LARYAIGDLQGCHEELQQLLQRLRFSADRDRLVFTGDLVNRGPGSLETLRLVRSLGANAQTVLGNHDLHLLAHAFDPAPPLRDGDTLAPVLAAPDRDRLVDWLLQQPLALRGRGDGDGELVVHAGLIPQWTADDAMAAADEAAAALRADPRAFLATMYGNEPKRWSADLPRADRLRFTVNVLTRLRFCDPDGRIDFRAKGAPDSAPPPLRPWFDHPDRRSRGTRIVFGHWSALGYLRRIDLLCLDTGCVWGGALTALDLDDPEARPVRIPCRRWQAAGGD
jgi:bis(5'-nucleosyl)-tetraphosphatase (symmetrical)